MNLKSLAGIAQFCSKKIGTLFLGLAFSICAPEVLAQGSGGTLTTNGAYSVMTFNSTGTFTLSATTTVDYLIVAGGGGGSSGGGGGGGIIYKTSISLPAGTYPVTIGAGGAGNGGFSGPGGNGGNSVFNGFTAIGGGRGGSAVGQDSATGGSGGGSGRVWAAGTFAGSAGTSGQGNAGGSCPGNASSLSPAGGGGGAGGAGLPGVAATNKSGAGGAGLSNSITGSAVLYGGGGGGGSTNAVTAGLGGSGGGGNGSSTSGVAGSSGTNGLGGGGGGGFDSSPGGGAGGSGVVIIRYLTAQSQTITWSVAPTTQHANTATTFTATGSNTGNYVWSVSPATGVTGLLGSSASEALTFASAGTYTVSVYSAAGGTYLQSPTINATITIDVPGPTLTTNGAYSVMTFTNSGTFTLSSPTTVDYLIVAGGGGGSSGGGGGGGTIYMTSVSLPAGSYPVTVGAAGAGNGGYAGPGVNGGNSAFNGYTAIGGGRGGSAVAQDSATGGSGGGSGRIWAAGTFAGSAGTSGQGNAGGSCPGNGSSLSPAGGGGGAGAAGLPGVAATNTSGAGGTGVSNSITGSAILYSGGGGGGSTNGMTAGGGGSGGGGNGSSTNGVAGSNGTNGLGGGGGGGFDSSPGGGAGGSGVVIIRYLTAQPQTITWSAFPTPVYVNTPTTFTATGSNTGTYVWSVSPATGVTGLSGNGASQTITFASAGTYAVSVYSAANSSYAQSPTITGSIVVERPPTVSVTISPTSVNFGQSATVTVTGNQGSAYTNRAISSMYWTGSTWATIPGVNYNQTGWSTPYPNDATTFFYNAAGFPNENASGAITTISYTVTAKAAGTSNAFSGWIWDNSYLAGVQATSATGLTTNKATPTATFSAVTKTPQLGVSFTVGAGDLNATFVNPYSATVVAPTGAVTYTIAPGSPNGTVGSAVSAGSVLTAGLNYTIRATYSGDSNYNSTTVDSLWTISRVPITAAVISAVVYNGSAQYPTVASTTPAGATVTVSATGPQTNAGTYNTGTVTGTGSYSGTLSNISWTISPLPITAATITPLSYNGSAQSPSAVTNTSPAGATVSVSAPAQTNANTYNTATISGTGNYSGTLNNVPWTINPVAVTAATISQLTYNGSAQSPSAVASVTPVGATVNVSAPAQTNAGTYITATVTGSGNYTGTLSNQAWTINRATPATPTISASANPAIYGGSVIMTPANGTTNLYAWQVNGTTVSTYNGSSWSATSGSYTGGTWTISGLNLILTPTSVVNFTVNFQDTGNANYNAATSTTLSETVNKAPITAAMIQSVTYNGSPQGPTTVSSVTPTGATVNVSAPMQTSAGTYTTATVIGTGNYTGTLSGQSWTINPLPITAVTIAPLTYNGNPQSPSVVIDTSPAGATVNVSAPPQTNASTYNTAIVTGTGNYGGTLTNVPWTINPLPITAASITPLVYTGSPQSPSATSSTVPAGATVSVSAPAQTNADTYNTATVTGTGNYTGTLPNQPWTIGKAPQTISWSVAPTSATVGATVTFTATGSTTGNYVWSVTPAGPTGITGNGASQNITFPAGGDYTVSVYSDTNSNYDASQPIGKSIHVDVPPTVTISISPATVEFGQSATVTFSATQNTDPLKAISSLYQVGGTQVSASIPGVNYNHTNWGTEFPNDTTAFSYVVTGFPNEDASGTTITKSFDITAKSAGTSQAFGVWAWDQTGEIPSHAESAGLITDKATPTAAFADAAKILSTGTTYAAVADDLNATFVNPYSTSVASPTGVTTYTISPDSPTGTAGAVVTVGTEFAAGSTYIIRATYPGDDNYDSTTHDATWTIGKAAQTIAFLNPGNQTYGTPLTLVATASSGLPVSFSVTSGLATIANGVVTFTGIGSVTITASQAGNDVYAAADNDAQTFNVDPITPIITSPTNASGQVGSTFSYQITADNLPTSFGATGLPGGLSINSSSGVISGVPIASGGTTLTISAANSAGTGFATLTINIAPNAPPNISLNSTSLVFGSTTPVGLSFDATSASSTIASMQVYRNGNLVTTLTSATSGSTWNFTESSTLPPGTYTYFVRAYDGYNTYTDSSPVTVKVLPVLPYSTDFEPAEGYSLGTLNGQLGWNVGPGAAIVSNLDFAHGAQSVQLVPNTPPSVLGQTFASSSGQTVEFFDFYAKPVAGTPPGTASTFTVEQSEFAFQLSGSQGTLQVFSGNGSGGGTWASTPFTIPLDANNLAQNWVRLTARLDFTRQLWDLYANSQMIAADVPFVSVSSYLSTFQLQGDVTTASGLDDIYAGPANPLFADVNNDGIDDAWETAHGLSLTTNNRALSPAGNGVTVLQAYLAGTDPNDFYNGAAPTLTIVSGNNQSAWIGQLTSQPFIVSVKNAAGTAPLANAPVIFTVQSGGGQLATTNTGSPALSTTLSLTTDTNGNAQAYYQQPVVEGQQSQVRVSAGLAQAIFDTNANSLIDTDGNGLPDAWETQYFGHIGVDPAADPDGDGLTNLQEYQNGTDPTDFYNNTVPVITSLVDPSGVPGANGLVLVKIARASDGAALVGAPVTLSVTPGISQLAAMIGGAGSNQIDLKTNSLGIAHAYVNFTNSASDVLLATARSGNQTAALSIGINAAVSNPANIYTTDFETAEGYAVGSLNGQLGWSVSQGSASVTNQDASFGTQSVVLQSGTTPARINRTISSTGPESVVYVDLFAKANPATSAIFDLGVARISFYRYVISPNESQLILQYFNGSYWAWTAFSLPITGGNLPQNWIRVTARLDYVHKTYDLYANGTLVAADLNFLNTSSTALTTVSITGDTSVPLELDHFSVGTINPLFADANGDGIDDAWENLYGLSLSLNDRYLDPAGNGKTIVQDYLNGADPTDYYNGVLPTLKSLGQSGPQGLVSVLATGYGNPLVNAPLVFTATTGSSQLSSTPGGIGAAQIMVRTNADGIAQVYTNFVSAASDVLTVSAQSGSQTTIISISVIPPSSVYFYASDFEASEGYTLGALNGQQGWSVLQGTATVANQDAFAGSQSAILAVGTVPAQIVHAISAASGGDIVYVDFYTKPSAEPDSTQSTAFDIGGARFRFGVGYQSDDGNHVDIETFNGDGSGGGQWSQTAASYVFGWAQASPDWIRCTIRLDYTHKTWDIYADGKIVAANLGFTDNTRTSLSSVTLTGDANSSSIVDRLSISAANPLFADINGDGIDDAWEALYGLDLTINDRNLDLAGNGQTVLQDYLSGASPTDYYNGVQPVVTSQNQNGQLALDGSFSVLVTNSSGTPLVNAPVAFQDPLGGNSIALDPSGATLNSAVTVRTDANGVAKIYIPSLSHSGLGGTATVNVGTGVGATQQQQSVTLSSPPIAIVLSEVVDQRVNEYGFYLPDGSGIYANRYFSGSGFGQNPDYHSSADPQTGQETDVGIGGFIDLPSEIDERSVTYYFSSVQMVSPTEQKSEIDYYYVSTNALFGIIKTDYIWSNPYPADYLLTEMAKRTFSAFTGNFVDTVQTALLDYQPPVTGPLSGTFQPHYEIAKMHYKLKIAPGYTGTLSWFEVFTPSDTTQPAKYLPMSCLITSGMTETQVYAIDPKGVDPMDANAASRYPNQNGTYSVVPYNAELAADANRDGQIALSIQDPSDVTSATAPFRFWINDDDDGETSIQTIGTVAVTRPDESDRVPISTMDYTRHQIVSLRNLEDFARLWINLSGLQSSLTEANPSIQIGLKWQADYTGTPAINVYLAADTNGSNSYLTNGTAAQNQLAGGFNNALLDVNGKQTVDTSGTFIFPAGYFSSLALASPTLHLLFEGAGEGSGHLVVVLLDQNGGEIATGPGVWLDLKNIKKMYQRGFSTAGNTTEPYTYTDTLVGPNITLGTDPNASQTFSPPSDETPQCIVFVHGFNITYDESTNYAETMFKRLWWHGYKGRFAAFRWPTYGSGGVFGGVGTYNDSEYMAWNSGTALKQFVATMPSGYGINLVAHSMGNMVVGEALREGMAASHYAMLHGATSASCYSNGDFQYNVTNNGTLTADNDLDPATKNLAYSDWLGSIGVSTVNFYDSNDSIVGNTWNVNNSLFKPQTGHNSIFNYYYVPTLPAGQRLGLNREGLLRNVTDPAEAKAYVDFSLTGTIGFGQNGTKGGSIADSVDDSYFGDEHSSEWDRNIQELVPFYNTLMLKFGQTPNP
jgi:Alpha/beta hydrolase of unknown function (DUF900)